MRLDPVRAFRRRHRLGFWSGLLLALAAGVIAWTIAGPVYGPLVGVAVFGLALAPTVYFVVPILDRWRDRKAGEVLWWYRANASATDSQLDRGQIELARQTIGALEPTPERDRFDAVRLAQRFALLETGRADIVAVAQAARTLSDPADHRYAEGMLAWLRSSQALAQGGNWLTPLVAVHKDVRAGFRPEIVAEDRHRRRLRFLMTMGGEIAFVLLLAGVLLTIGQGVGAPSDDRPDGYGYDVKTPLLSELGRTARDPLVPWLPQISSVLRPAVERATRAGDPLPPNDTRAMGGGPDGATFLWQPVNPVSVSGGPPGARARIVVIHFGEFLRTGTPRVYITFNTPDDVAIPYDIDRDALNRVLDLLYPKSG